MSAVNKPPEVVTGMDAPFEARLLEAGKAVARLPRARAPEGLAARTLARVAAAMPLGVRKRLWILRPITNPFARCAAAAAILLLLVPLSDLDFARTVGSTIEADVVGRRIVDRMENIMDDVLPRGAPGGYSQTELDAFNNVQSTNKSALKIQVRTAKPNLGA